MSEDPHAADRRALQQFLGGAAFSAPDGDGCDASDLGDASDGGEPGVLSGNEHGSPSEVGQNAPGGSGCGVPSADDSSASEPEPEVAEHDPTGLDLAFEVAASAGAVLPPPRTNYHRRRRRPEREPGQPEAIGDLLGQVVERQGWGKQVNLRLLLNRWGEWVGPANAEHSHPESFQDAVLTVRADSTTWASALRAIAPQVLATLNEHLGDGTVRRIEVKGPDAPSWKHGIRSVRDGRGPRDTYG